MGQTIIQRPGGGNLVFQFCAKESQFSPNTPGRAVLQWVTEC